MFRFIVLAYYHSARLTLRLLMQFEWFQRYVAWLGWAMGKLLKLWLWLAAFVLITWLFWDLLPFVALAYMGHHAIRFQHRNDWV